MLEVVVEVEWDRDVGALFLKKREGENWKRQWREKWCNKNEFMTHIAVFSFVINIPVSQMEKKYCFASLLHRLDNLGWWEGEKLLKNSLNSTLKKQWKNI